jgi:hypothetical protein
MTEEFAETTTQKRLALANWRFAVDKGHPEFMKDVRRMERLLEKRLESVGGIDKFNEYVDACNAKFQAERPRMRPVEDWP